jgi:hypothetical protein
MWNLRFGETVEVFEVFFQHKKKVASLGRRDCFLQWFTINGKPRVNRVEVVVQIFVVDELGLTRLEIQTLFARWRRMESLNRKI